MAARQAHQDDRPLNSRRKLGTFYTPEPLSQILSSWAIQTNSDTVLEPSFGGCGFLQSARTRLLELGSTDPKAQIYGCDIDPVAFDHLATLLGFPVDLDRFIKGDFLQFDPRPGWPEQFSTIVANPPYIPYQALSSAQRKELANQHWVVGQIGGRASLWAYFVAHAITFLAKGGRMAWVLPGAFLQADYARSLRSYLSAHFARGVAIVLRERMFMDAGTDEETVILLADGFELSSSGHGIEVGEAKTLLDLTDLIARWDAQKWHGRVSLGRPAALSLKPAQRLSLAKVDASVACTNFGDVATVQIGIVTGANEFFVLSKDRLEKAGLQPADCKPIMGKFHAARGLNYDEEDHHNFVEIGGRAYLIDTTTISSERLDKYLRTFPEDRKALVSTFKKRKVWSAPDDGRIADAFFPVMHHAGPRIALNPSHYVCTNTIHRVYFKQDLALYFRQLIAISMLTTFSQLSAELVGRRYGSGVLKHEPREAERIRLLIPKVTPKRIEHAFFLIDQCLRSNDQAAATSLADAFIYPAAGLLGWKVTAMTLAQALNEMRSRRRPQARPQK